MKINAIDNNGNLKEYDAILTYHSDEFNKDYVVFQVRGEGSASAAIYHPEDNGKGSLERIESDEEWEMLEELLNDYASSMEDSSFSGCSGCTGCHSAEECGGCGECQN
jgi:uncharacterized protein YrzB (UPF0473 family)